MAVELIGRLSFGNPIGASDLHNEQDCFGNCAYEKGRRWAAVSSTICAQSYAFAGL